MVRDVLFVGIIMILMERDTLGRVGSATGLDSTKQATVLGVAKTQTQLSG